MTLVPVISQNDTVLYFPATHHIVTKNDGTGGYNASFIPLIMKELNRAFAPANIQFYLSCVGIDTIKSDALYDIDVRNSNSPHRDSLNRHNVLNIINIYGSR